MKEVSRQRKWQLKKQRDGLCKICGGKKEREDRRMCNLC